MAGNYPDGVSEYNGTWNEPPEVVEDPWEGIGDDIRRLAVAQALQKVIGPYIKTKDRHNLRGTVDAYFAHLYEDTRRVGAPVKSFDINVGGKKVGTYSITATEDEDAWDETVFDVADGDALFKWAMLKGYVAVDMDAVYGHIAETGEVPDGMEPRTVHHAAVQGGAIKQTALRISPEKVEDALEVGLIEPVAALLEGEE